MIRTPEELRALIREIADACPDPDPAAVTDKVLGQLSAAERKVGFDYAGAAAQLGVSVRWLVKNKARFPHLQLGTRVRFLPEHIDEIRRMHEQRPAPASGPREFRSLTGTRPSRLPRNAPRAGSGDDNAPAGPHGGVAGRGAPKSA